MKKKKIIIISLTILIAIILTILISLYIFIRHQLTIKGIIVEYNENEIYQNNILVYEEDKKTLTYIGLPENTNLKFKPGQVVIIYLSYNTCTVGSYPAQIESEFIKKIKIIKEDSIDKIEDTIKQLTTRKQEQLYVQIQKALFRI